MGISGTNYKPPTNLHIIFNPIISLHFLSIFITKNISNIKKLVGGKISHCQAFPITLVLPDEQKDNSDAFMKTHLNDTNFNGKIEAVYNKFISTIKTT